MMGGYPGIGMYGMPGGMGYPGGFAIGGGIGLAGGYPGMGMYGMPGGMGGGMYPYPGMGGGMYPYPGMGGGIGLAGGYPGMGGGMYPQSQIERNYFNTPSQMPTSAIGSESTMPIVNPPDSASVTGSGSRKSSAKLRVNA